MISHTRLIHQILFPSLIWKMNSGSIYLTFDDGPHPQATPLVLDLLDAEQVEATFFLTGEAVARFPSLVKDIASGGHSIGVHAYHHTRKAAFSKQNTKSEIRTTEAAIRQHVELPNKLFRPPYGFFTWNSIAAAEEMGYKFIMWTVLTGDFRQWPVDKIVKNATHRLASGSILVFHDNELTVHTVAQVVRESIRQIRDLGFTFKKIS